MNSRSNGAADRCIRPSTAAEVLNAIKYSRRKWVPGAKIGLLAGPDSKAPRAGHRRGAGVYTPKRMRGPLALLPLALRRDPRGRDFLNMF